MTCARYSQLEGTSRGGRRRSCRRPSTPRWCVPTDRCWCRSRTRGRGNPIQAGPGRTALQRTRLGRCVRRPTRPAAPSRRAHRRMACRKPGTSRRLQSADAAGRNRSAGHRAVAPGAPAGAPPAVTVPQPGLPVRPPAGVRDRRPGSAAARRAAGTPRPIRSQCSPAP